MTNATNIKTCGHCHKDKDRVDFYPNSKTRSGLRSVCKDCEKEKNKSYYSTNPDYWRMYNRDNLSPEDSFVRGLWAKYRISMERYIDLSKNGCNVCGSFERLSVDHDHGCCAGRKSCGKCVRGILCHKCNVAEGMMDSDLDRIILLANYLRNNSIGVETK